MIVVSVMYPTTEGKTFDFDYYTGTHMPLVQAKWGGFGVAGIQVLKGQPGPTGAAPDFVVITNLTFASLEDFHNAGRAHGREIMGDVRNFTDIVPVTQISEPLSV